MKTCPKCGSHKIIVFSSDNDMCTKCNKWFPAVKDIPTKREKWLLKELKKERDKDYE